MKLITPREIVMSVTTVFLAIITGFLVEWDFSKLMENQTIIAYFLIGGILASLGYGWKPRIDRLFGKHENNDKNKEIYQKIHTELKDSLDSLDSTLDDAMDRETKEVMINGGKIIYKHIFMNIESYNASINSGEFNLIESKLQQPIQDVYGKIKTHNEFVQKVVDIEFNPEPMKVPDDYNLTLNKYEKELLLEIPVILKKLISH